MASDDNGDTVQPISGIGVAGFKSIRDKQRIEVRPLTLLAGANSSGKSSIVQPLLLLKQTLDATYDPGALLLDGPNVRFTLADQLLYRSLGGPKTTSFTTEVAIGESRVLLTFEKQTRGGFDLSEMGVTTIRGSARLARGMSAAEIASSVSAVNERLQDIGRKKWDWNLLRVRCFFRPAIMDAVGEPSASVAFDSRYAANIRRIIHLPGLRGNPERTYPVTAVGPNFPGLFHTYTASVIADWQSTRNTEILNGLNSDLQSLDLTWRIVAHPVSDTQVELRVGRLPRPVRGGGRDLVSIADVGVGVSQTLPVVVALRAAQPGQIVYLEQPEIHLHPRAQASMAALLASAAQRGVIVIAETHSSLLLLAIQRMVAEGTLQPDLLKLHWFTRSDGVTTVSSAELDETGAFGDWPADFDEVSLREEAAYLTAAESRMTQE
jgi:hypothetical protein